MIEMRNASKEKIKTQCNSKVFKFGPEGVLDEKGKDTSIIQVPDDLAIPIYNQLSDWGVYPVYSHMSKEQIDEERIKALRAYHGGILQRRIENYVREKDEYQRKGVTLMPSKAFERATRWSSELSQVLDKISPQDQEYSFLPAKEKTKKELSAEVK